MPIMEVQTVTKKVAVFRTSCLSPNELIILMSYSLYNRQDDHFEDMDDYTKIDVLEGLSSYWNYCGGEVSCGKVYDEDDDEYHEDGDYRFEIRTSFADKDNLKIRVTIHDTFTGRSYTEVYTDSEFMEFYDIVDFAGSEEDWNEVEN